MSTVPRLRAVRVVLADGGEFLEAYRAFGESGALYLRDRDDLEEGEQLELELAFEHSEAVMHVPCKVLERTTVRPDQKGGGALVELLCAERQRDALVAHARGLRPLVRRGSRRVPVRIAVEYTEDQRFHLGITEDLGYGGAAIRCVRPLPSGPLLALRLRLDGGETLVVNAEVAWRRHDPPSFGVRFLLSDETKRRRLTAFVAGHVAVASPAPERAEVGDDAGLPGRERP